MKKKSRCTVVCVCLCVFKIVSKPNAINYSKVVCACFLYEYVYIYKCFNVCVRVLFGTLTILSSSRVVIKIMRNDT